MFSNSQLVVLAFYALSALAAPSPLLRISKAQDSLPGRYIVTLKQEPGTSSTENNVKTFTTIVSSASNITHQWESMGAFAGELSDDDLETLRAHPRVEAIEQDGIMKTLANVTQCVPLYPTPVTSTNVDETRLGTTLLGA